MFHVQVDPDHINYYNASYFQEQDPLAPPPLYPLLRVQELTALPEDEPAN